MQSSLLQPARQARMPTCVLWLLHLTTLLTECVWAPFDKQPWLCGGWERWHREETGSPRHKTSCNRQPEKLWKFSQAGDKSWPVSLLSLKPWPGFLSSPAMEGRGSRHPPKSTIVPGVQCSNRSPGSQTAQNWVLTLIPLSSLTLGKGADYASVSSYLRWPRGKPKNERHGYKIYFSLYNFLCFPEPQEYLIYSKLNFKDLKRKEKQFVMRNK